MNGKDLKPEKARISDKMYESYLKHLQEVCDLDNLLQFRSCYYGEFVSSPERKDLRLVCVNGKRIA